MTTFSEADGARECFVGNVEGYRESQSALFTTVY